MSRNPTTLPQVVKELVDRILEGDCLRVGGSAGDFYYVVGQKAQERVDQSPMQRLHQPDVEPLDSFATWFTRRQVAAPSIDHIAAVQKRLIARGIPSGWLERLLEAARGKDSGLLAILGEQGEALYGYYELLLDVLAVLKVELVAAKGEPPEPTTMRPAIDARYLKELAEKYPGVVDRASRLEPLTYSDPQLAEACRCFLYGFYRATIVLSAVAVETALKANTTQGLPDQGMYAALVNAVFGPAGSRGTDPAQAHSFRNLFKTRNDIVHDEKEPDEDTALEILVLARAAIGRLVGEGT